MKSEDKAEKIGQVMSHLTDADQPAPDFESWLREHPQAIKTLTSRAERTERSFPSPAQRIWRKTMNSRIIKLTTAAVILLAFVLGIIYFFGSSPDGANIVLADVEKAFLAQDWVHIKYDNGRERWNSLKEGKSYYKHENGRTVTVDEVNNIRRIYDPRYWQSYIQEDRPYRYSGHESSPWQPSSVWEKTLGHLEKIMNNSNRPDLEVEKHTEIIDDIELVRFELYYYDAIDRRLLLKQIWADSQTRLPVKVRERLPLAEREEQKREFIIGRFDFPTTGPSSIYDLGVPRDLPILKRYDKTADPFVVQVLQAGKKAYENFPKRYLGIRWDNEKHSEIDIVWRNKEKLRYNRYFNMKDYPEYRLDLPTDAEQIQTWSKTQIPVNISLYDGDRSFRKSGPLPEPFVDQKEPTVSIYKSDYVARSKKLHEEMWPYVGRRSSSFEWIEEIPSDLINCVGLQIGTPESRKDFYVDPGHDYICVYWIWWKKGSNGWRKEREYKRSNFNRLPQGQWYASKDILITYGDPERGIGQGGANWCLYFKVLDEYEFPPDIFNGEKLLEGAKIETY